MPRKKSDDTLQKIKQAFITLMNDKEFANLSVSDISKAARINRGTFYLHYLDKFDLLDQMEHSILDRLQNMLKQGFPQAIYVKEEKEAFLFPFELLADIAKFLYDERDLVCALLNDHSTASFMAKMKKCFLSYVQTVLPTIRGNLSFRSNIPSIYAQEIIFGHVVSIFQCWLMEGQTETPVEIAEIIVKSRSISPFEMLDI